MPSLTGILGAAAPAVGGAVGNYFVPGMGGMIGGAAGQGLGSILSYLYPDQPQGQAQQMNPQQGQMLQGMDNNARSYLLQQLMSQNQGSSFDPIEQRYRRQFNEQTLPRINEQFGGSGLGGSGPHRSAISTAETDLAERLAALRSQHQLQSDNMSQNRLGMLGQYLGGQGQLGIQGQQLGLQRERQSEWGPTLSALGGLGIGLGGLGLNAYNAYNQNLRGNREQDLTERLASLGQYSQGASFRPNAPTDITFRTATPGLLG